VKVVVSDNFGNERVETHDRSYFDTDEAGNLRVYCLRTSQLTSIYGQGRWKEARIDS
jgi:hypothetical protein